MRELIYISYSHHDKFWHGRTREILDRDARLRDIIWDDTKIQQAGEWLQQINEHLSRTKIMIMLVSQDYLNPDCLAYNLEFKTAVQAHFNRELTIFWIPVKDSEWNESPIGNILSATRSTIPLDSLNSTEQFRALERVYHSILNHLGLGPRDDFDVFMCHNTKDKPEVERIALQLKHRGLRPWLDKWQLRPGFPWQRVLEDQIKMIGAAAVFVGPGGMGPWQQLEQEGFLRQFVKRACPVIPVILPGVQQEPALPNFLEGMGWVDFRESDPDPLDSLIFGITGSNPHL